MGPTGVPQIMETKIPRSAQIADIIVENTVTDLNVLKTRIAERAGNIINAEIRREPTRFIARTITTAITIAIKRL